MSNPFEGFDPVKLLPVVNALRGYHTHQVYGMENIPKEGPAILASNHSLATYDLIMLYGAIYEQTGRMVRPLMDRLFSETYRLSLLFYFDRHRTNHRFWGKLLR